MKLKTRKIALFGTSADPPTNGHKEILEKLSKEYDLVISFASSNPSKIHKENLFYRSLLLETLINNLNNPKVLFDQEISSPWAFNSIKACKDKYKKSEISFVIGSDLLEELLSWKNIQKIIKEVKFLLIPRKGYQINLKTLVSIKNYGGIIEISSLKIRKTSSSMIKSQTKESFLPQSVLEIVKNNNLYDSFKIRK